jgi:hypothetical protein
MSHQPDNIFAGTQVVALVEIRGPNKSACTYFLQLLLTCAATLREAPGPVRVELQRDRLLVAKLGGLPWAKVDCEHALAETKLSRRPNYETANRFLIRARWKRAKSTKES